MAINMKYLSLLVLVFQTTAVVIMLRYSRISKVSGARYLPSTAVFIGEIIKLVTCSGVLFVQQGYNAGKLSRLVVDEVIKKPLETSKMLVPSLLYTVQNNLLFVALSNLNAATYQVTYQLKILTTALFSVILLNKQISPTKWLSLVILTVGVALVQIPSGETKQPEKPMNVSSQFVGLCAVLCACFSSGFAGVYFEKVLKGSKQSLWIRNIQLASFSIVTGLCGVFVTDYHVIAKDGFFQGYNHTTWIVIALQAYGGILVALVVKNADNILKGFATALAIITSTILSSTILGDFTPSGYFYIGSTIVVAATVLYGLDLPRKKVA